MLSRPDAADLIELARETLREEILPLLEGEKRYQGLMVSNALAIALRELAEPGDAEQARERALLHELYGDALDSSQSLRELNAHLARDIRAGEHDGAMGSGLRRLLKKQVLHRLRVSNPRRAGG